MPRLRDVRDCLLMAHAQHLIHDAEFLFLYKASKSRNLDIPYWKYQPFDLDQLTDDECRGDFRFLKNDVYLLKDILLIPDEINCYNRTKVDGIEGLCIFLKRFAYPCRYSDMIPIFGRSVQELCLVSNYVMDTLYNLHGNLLTCLNQRWLSPVNLENLCNAIHQSGATLGNCWGFVDGTVRPVCRPNENQRVLYNGHKRIHSIKFQSLVSPNGLIANFFGPVEGKRHDSGMLAASGLLNQLAQFSHSQTGNPLCIYGDPAYPLHVHLQAPFKGAALTDDQKAYNKSMSKARVSVEWVFGDITNYFAFLDFRKNLKVGLSAVGKMYITCALLHNARNCLYGNTTSQYFDVQPSAINDYFQ